MVNIPPQGYKKLSGSERQPLANAHPIGSVDPGENIEVSLYLRAPSTGNLTNLISEQVQHKVGHLSREEYRARHSAAPEDIASISRCYHHTRIFSRPMAVLFTRDLLTGRRA